MAGVNKVIILGNLGRDPEIRELKNGNKVCRLNVATTRTWKSSDTGDKVEETEWHRVSVWGPQAEPCHKFLSKGRQVYVEGRLRTSSYEKDVNGTSVTMYGTEIVAENVQFVGGKNSDSNTSDTSNAPTDDAYTPSDDDDIEF